MVRITIDAKLPERLATLREPAELVTEEGRRVGRFLPEGPVMLTLAEARAAGLCPFSDEEIESMRSETFEGRPLAEVWKDLGRQ
jgi:hypothetical protein